MRRETCSGDDELRDWLSGILPVDVAERVSAHLDHCPHCQSTLETVSNVDDTLITCLRRPPVQDGLLDEPQFREAVRRAKTFGAAPCFLGQTGKGVEPDPEVLGQLGEYHILEKLAEGGMGMVYKALHTKLGREVAVKVLPTAAGLATERAIARFEREMKAIGQLDHPHIVRALDAREVEGTRFLVLDYVDGTDLAKLVHQRGPLPVDEACDLLRQAAMGLQYAHEHQLIHRDVKPSNLMVDRQGRLKVLDLGLARFRPVESSGDEVTGTGQTLGTAGYMAPEQASDTHSVDARADIYGLGCTLHYLLVGRAPYAGETAYQLLTAHHKSPIPSLRAERADVPENLDRVFRKMVAKTPAERQASMAAVIEDLESCLADEKASSAGTDLPHARFATTQARPNTRRVVLALVGVATIPMLLLAVVMFKLRTNVGTPVISVDHQDAEVVVDDATIKIASRGDSDPTEIPATEGAPPQRAVAPFSAEQAKQHQQAWADYLGLPVEWRNSLGMQFMLIPPGEFLMGASEEEQTRFREEASSLLQDDAIALEKFKSWILAESPQHLVKISQPFYLTKHEVTQSQWEAAMGYNPSSFKSPTRPVEDVSWQDIQVFLKFNGADTLGVPSAEMPLGAWRMTFTLPTEAQWEYACRAGTSTAFSYGDRGELLGEYGWFQANAEATTHEVGQLKPNAWGLYDMHGNVTEWCADRYESEYYARSPRIDPVGPPAGGYRVIRGGSWGYLACHCRSAHRRGLSTGFRYKSIGFRLAVLLTGKR